MKISPNVETTRATSDKISPGKSDSRSLLKPAVKRVFASAGYPHQRAGVRGGRFGTHHITSLVRKARLVVVFEERPVKTEVNRFIIMSAMMVETDQDIGRTSSFECVDTVSQRRDAAARRLERIYCPIIAA